MSVKENIRQSRGSSRQGAELEESGWGKSTGGKASSQAATPPSHLPSMPRESGNKLAEFYFYYHASTLYTSHGNLQNMLEKLVVLSLCWFHFAFEILNSSFNLCKYLTFNAPFLFSKLLFFLSVGYYVCLRYFT